MTKYSKFNIIYLLQKWLDSVPGQTFMNYAYSWGASIVILGALFKLTHLPGANFMLFLGMGTEVLVFFIAGFDRPFDKTEDGKDLPTHVMDEDDLQDDVAVGASEGAAGGFVGGGGGGTIIIGGGAASGAATESQQTGTGDGTISFGGGGTGGAVVGGAGGAVVGGVVGGVAQAEAPDIDAEGMEEATESYVEQLKKLTETLQKVAEQSERLTRDSEEMENLNRTLTGICKVYEMQLKGASQQIGTIDEINDQTRKMAEQIAELNRIYARMIEAMTTNMPKLNNNGN
jgi:hypothetical protein